MLHNRRVHSWQSRFDAATRTHHHTIGGRYGHAVLSQAAAFTFKVLDVSVSVCDGDLWWPIHVGPGIREFEQEHGRDIDRARYNVHQLAQAARTGKLVRGEHAGYSDLYQPIVIEDEVIGVVVTGPFARSRPQAADILERWNWLTGRKAHPNDPEFSSYLEATFSMLVLEGKRAVAFERLLDRFALMLAERGRADELTNEMDRLRVELEPARAVERAWDAVRSMLDPRFTQQWHGGAKAWTLSDLGLSRVPDGILVGLTVSRTFPPDAVEEAVRRNEFQRRSVDLSRAIGDTLVGRVGGHGVVFVSAASGSVKRRKQRLLDLAQRAGALARRLDLSIHFGLCVRGDEIPLSRSYDLALGAAESALAQRAGAVRDESEPRRSADSLRQLREELARAVEEKPELCGARFDQYLEAVALRSGHRIEPAQAHLEVGFERMADVLVRDGTLDAKSLKELRGALDRTATDANTIADLFEAYRQAAADLARAVQNPMTARHDRNLRAATEYIRDHYGESLSLQKVARVAGFNRTYFSEVFRKWQGVSFQQYLRRFRLERAQQLLAAGRLSVAQVAERSGFHTLQYFSQIFRATFHVTPSQYRKSVRATPQRKKRASRASR